MSDDVQLAYPFTLKHKTMARSKWLVIYKRLDESIKEELTTNVTLTVSALEAQGFIIIDIVDVG